MLRSKLLKMKYLVLLATNTTLNDKIIEVKGEIPNTTKLATITAVSAAENKIPNVSYLVKQNWL